MGCISSQQHAFETTQYSLNNKNNIQSAFLIDHRVPNENNINDQYNIINENITINENDENYNVKFNLVMNKKSNKNSIEDNKHIYDDDDENDNNYNNSFQGLPYVLSLYQSKSQTSLTSSPTDSINSHSQNTILSILCQPSISPPTADEIFEENTNDNDNNDKAIKENKHQVYQYYEYESDNEEEDADFIVQQHYHNHHQNEFELPYTPPFQIASCSVFTSSNNLSTNNFLHNIHNMKNNNVNDDNDQLHHNHWKNNNNIPTSFQVQEQY